MPDFNLVYYDGLMQRLDFPHVALGNSPTTVLTVDTLIFFFVGGFDTLM
jgi:hypothetical protein